MAIGKSYTMKCHEVDASTLVVDSVVIKDFSHESSFVAATTSVVKEDFPSTDYDSFTVKINYPSTALLAGSTTLNGLRTLCSTAIRAAFSNDEVVSV